MRIRGWVVAGVCLLGIGCGEDEESPARLGPIPIPRIEPSDDGSGGGDDGEDVGDPDFRIEASPEDLDVPQGGVAMLSVTVTRIDGFDEAIDVTIDGLPDGIVATPLELGPAETTGSIALAAAATTGVPEPTSARVRGHASSGTRSDPIFVTVRGESGAVDPSFGASGVSTVMTQIFDVDEQVDGRLVVAGWDSGDSLVVCRLEPDGSRDASFGTEGCSPIFTFPAFGVEVAVESSGIIVVGWADSRTFVARFTDDGWLDPTFGTEGITDLGAEDVAQRPYAALTVDGAVLVTGMRNDGMNLQAYLARFLADGTLDTTFGDGGQVLFAAQWGRDLLRLADGRIVVLSADGLELYAFTPDGKIATAFGNAGKTTLGETSTAITRVGNDIVCAGIGASVVRLDSMGKTLGSWSALDTGESWIEPSDFAVREGVYVFGGTRVGEGDSGEFAIARRASSGSPDEDFAPGGVGFYDVGTEAYDLEVLRDGRYLLVGTRWPENGILLRVWD